jgi:uncharacterized integral membrane protein
MIPQAFSIQAIISLYFKVFFCYNLLVTKTYARVVELVDTLALGASAFGRGGSSPLSRTKFI